IKEIKKFTKEHNFIDSAPIPKKIVPSEPLEVVKEEEILYKEIKVEKIAIGYKMLRSKFPIKKDVLLDLYLSMILTLNFGSSSDFNEQIRKKHLVSHSSYSFDDAKNIRIFYIEADVLNEEEF